MKLISKSQKQTFNLAKKIAAELTGGEALCLIGDLGAGKTAFTKGLAAGLGITKIITSPTFVLMKVYSFSSPFRKGRLGGVKFMEQNIKPPRHFASAPLSKRWAGLLVHIDAYRLECGEQLAGIGALDYFEQPGVITVIEWADRVKDIWPDNTIKIEFKILKGDKREIKITQH